MNEKKNVTGIGTKASPGTRQSTAEFLRQLMVLALSGEVTTVMVTYFVPEQGRARGTVMGIRDQDPEEIDRQVMACLGEFEGLKLEMVAERLRFERDNGE